MSEKSVIFADRLMNVAITGPLVRLQWGAMEIPRAEGEKPALHPTQTLVLPLDGLLASLGMIDGLVNQLVKEGIINPTASSPSLPQ